MSAAIAEPSTREVLIKGFTGYKINTNGVVYTRRQQKEWRPLKPTIDKFGYLRVRLFHNRKCYRLQVHRLVLISFVGDREPGQVCRHLDGNSRNNTVSNLVWGTQKENIKDRVRHGTDFAGSRNPIAKLKESDIPIILRRHAAGESRNVIAKDFGVSVSRICDIVKGRAWKHCAVLQ